MLDLDRYIPFYLTTLSNKLSGGASRLYRELFGVGVTEWRVLSMLAVEPGIAASRICQALGFDKAAASRSLQTLERRGFVQGAGKGRSRPYRLTDDGQALHDSIMKLALERERRLLARLTPAEVDMLADLLRRMLAQIPEVNGVRPG